MMVFHFSGALRRGSLRVDLVVLAVDAVALVLDERMEHRDGRAFGAERSDVQDLRAQSLLEVP
jgi:hypothetical protein